MKWIAMNVPSNFQSLVRHHLPEYLAKEIVALPTKEARREAIDDVPLDCDPPWSRDLIKMRVMQLWKRRNAS
jgi:hypothetical protein